MHLNQAATGACVLRWWRPEKPPPDQPLFWSRGTLPSSCGIKLRGGSRTSIVGSPGPISPFLHLCQFHSAISWRRVRRKRAQEAAGDRRDVRDGCEEGGFIGLRGLVEAADLSNELE